MATRQLRPRYDTLDFVEEVLLECGLMDVYRSRPPYQQNDYIGWILRAKREGTRTKRLQQMLDELERGDVYMKMNYHPKRPRSINRD